MGQDGDGLQKEGSEQNRLDIGGPVGAGDELDAELLKLASMYAHTGQCSKAALGRVCQVRADCPTCAMHTPRARAVYLTQAAFLGPFMAKHGPAIVPLVRRTGPRHAASDECPHKAWSMGEPPVAPPVIGRVGR